MIRTETIGDLASRAGALSVVRSALLARQRAFRAPPGLVTDGRDMGTVVFSGCGRQNLSDSQPRGACQAAVPAVEGARG